MKDHINKVLLKHFNKGEEYIIYYSYIEDEITKDSEVTILAKGKSAHNKIEKTFNKCFLSLGYRVNKIVYC